jgi:hypothetical protein
MVVDRYRWPTISANDKVWKLAQLTLGSALPEHIVLEMEKVVATNQDAEKFVVVLRADHAWEDALDKLNGTISFPFGKLHFCKRSASKHGKVRHAREAVEAKAAKAASAIATAKAAKKTVEAEEAFAKAAENAMNEGMDQSDGSANKKKSMSDDCNKTIKLRQKDPEYDSNNALARLRCHINPGT